MLLSHALRASGKTTGGVTLYSIPGATVSTQTTYSIRVPDNVTSIAGLAIGGGGGGGGASSTATAAAGGGGGGALSFSNAITVTPGETLTVLVPNQSAAGTSAGGNGGNGLTASIARGGTILLSAVGGTGSLGRVGSTISAGGAGGVAASGVGDTKQAGGVGGDGNAPTDQGGGGGGAGGYSGAGGTGGSGGASGSAGTAGSSGSGGAGGGGASYTNALIGGSGGGTSWYGAGTSGAGGTASVTPSRLTLNGKLGSSIGGATVLLDSIVVNTNTENINGTAGGGGAGAPSGGAVAFAGMRGAGGAIRVLWGPSINWSSATNTSDNRLFVRSSSSSLTSSVSMPVVELGDTVYFIDFSQNTTGAPTAVTPSGFTLLTNSTTGTSRFTTYYKRIITSADTGTTLTGANGTSYNSKVVIVIAGKRGAAYSPRGSDTALNGAVETSVTSATLSLTVDSTDTWATGIPVGFVFFNTNVNTTSSSISYNNPLETTTVAGADSKTFVKVGFYPQATATSYSATATVTSLLTSQLTVPTTAIGKTSTATNTTLLLKYGNIATVTDGSSAPITMTNNSSALYNPASPFSGGTDGSIAFNGTTQYVQSGPTGAPTLLPSLGSGDFTVECWINASSFASENPVFKIYTSGSNNLEIRLPNGVMTALYNSGSATITGATLSIDTWYHIALVRSSTTLTMYVNGNSTGTPATISGSMTSPSLYLARNQSGTTWFSGSITNFRIVNSALYSGATYTIPTAALTAITGTQLLIKQTATSTATVTDGSAAPLTITNNGSSLYNSTSPFSGGTDGSIAFNGTSQYLSVPSTTALVMGTGDFTAEGWFYLNALGAVRGLVAKGTNTTGWEVRVTAANVLAASYTSTGLIGTTTIATNVWYHFALVRNGSASGNVKLYLNGTLEATSATAITTDFNQTDVLAIGNSRPLNQYFSGNITNVRIVKGTAVYTANFTPSTTALTAISGTSLLTQQTNSGIADVQDSSSAPLTITNTGSTYSSSLTPFTDTSVGSFAFNGTTQYSSIATPGTAFTFGTGNFTIEAWVYYSSTGSSYTVYSNGPATDSIAMGIHSDGKPYAAIGTTYGSVAENATLTLTPPSGYVMTSVLYGNYGINNGTAPNWTKGAAAGSQSDFETYCVNQTTASIPATNARWTDPISGTAKTLAVATTHGLMGSSALATNTWHHLALVRGGTGASQTVFYVNGSIVGAGTLATNYGASGAFYIGASVQASAAKLFYSGRIANLRIVKGAAVYTVPKNTYNFWYSCFY